MKRITTILLSLVMIFSCSYTAMAYTAADTKVKIIDSKGTRDITSKLGGRYLTGNENLMVPTEAIYKEMGVTVSQWNDKKTVFSAYRPDDNRIVGLNYDGSRVYGFGTLNSGKFIQDTQGYLSIHPVKNNNITMVAIQDLTTLWGDKVKFEPSTGTYYIVLDESKMNSAISKLPDATTGENMMAAKKSASNPNEIKCVIVIDGVSKDITATAKPKVINHNVMVEAKPVLEAFESFVVWNSETKNLSAYRHFKDKRTMEIKFDGSNVLEQGFNDGTPRTKINSSVSPKIINGIPMIYFGDVAKLIGGSASYDANTKTCTISEITGNQKKIESVTNVLNENNASYTNTTKESTNTVNSKEVKEKEEDALKKQREKEALERQRELAAKDKAQNTKTTRVLTEDGWVWMSEAEANKKKSSEKKVKILREGEGWVYVTEEEARQYRSNSNSSSNTNTSSSATTGRYVIGSGYQSAEDFNKSNNTTSTEKRKVLREGVGWVYE